MKAIGWIALEQLTHQGGPFYYEYYNTWRLYLISKYFWNSLINRHKPKSVWNKNVIVWKLLEFKHTVVGHLGLGQ